MQIGAFVYCVNREVLLLNLFYYICTLQLHPTCNMSLHIGLQLVNNLCDYAWFIIPTFPIRFPHINPTLLNLAASRYFGQFFVSFMLGIKVSSMEWSPDSLRFHWLSGSHHKTHIFSSFSAFERRMSRIHWPYQRQHQTCTRSFLLHGTLN